MLTNSQKRNIPAGNISKKAIAHSFIQKKYDKTQISVINDKRTSNQGQANIQRMAIQVNSNHKELSPAHKLKTLQTKRLLPYLNDPGMVIMRKKLKVTSEDLLYGRKEARNELEDTWEEHTDGTVPHVLDSKIDLKNQTIMDKLGLNTKAKMLKYINDRESLEQMLTEKILANTQAILERGIELDELESKIGQLNEDLLKNRMMLMRMPQFSKNLTPTIESDKEKLRIAEDRKTTLTKLNKFAAAQNRYMTNYTMVYNDIKHYVSKMGSKDIDGDKAIDRMCKYGITLPASKEKGGKVKFLLGQYTYNQLKKIPAKKSNTITDKEMRASFRITLENEGHKPEFYIRLSELIDMLEETDTDYRTVLKPSSAEIIEQKGLPEARNMILEVFAPWEWEGELGVAWAAYQKERQKLERAARLILGSGRVDEYLKYTGKKTIK